MKLFHKTTQVVLRSEEQRDEYIEKLQKAHVDYRVFEGQNTVHTRDKRFIVRMNAEDMKKSAEHGLLRDQPGCEEAGSGSVCLRFGLTQIRRHHHCTVFSGRHTLFRVEDPVKAGNALETRQHGDFSNRFILIRE